MTAVTQSTRYAAPSHRIRSVSLLQPLAWLRRGASDLLGCAPANFGHSLTMVALGWVLLLMLGRNAHFVAAAVTGFLLFAPIMATGLCELSRLRSLGQATGFDASLDVLNRTGRDLFLFGLLLAVATVAWFAISEAMIAGVFHVSYQDLATTYYHGFVDTASQAQVRAYVATGAILALVVFALSVVSVPMIIDHRASASEAVRTSLRVVLVNPLPMLFWAALITGLTAFGFATLLVGMIVVMPLLGHATWHAYRDLVE